MISLGIDPSLTSTGFVRLEDGKILEQRLIKTKPTNNPVEELERLLFIVNTINIEKADITMVEGIAFMVHNTSALVQLSALNYLIRERLYLTNKKFIIVPPTQLKKFVSGKGNAPKELVMLEAYKRYHISFKDNNLADAYVLARIGEALLNENVKLTKFQEEVIEILK